MTERLVALALEYWREIEGLAVSQNMPSLTALPLHRFCSFIWWWATRNAEDEKALAKFENAMWRPPAGWSAPIPAESPWSPERENAAFGALKAGLGR